MNLRTEPLLGALALVCFFSSGCSSVFRITSDPPGASVSINGVNYGTTPTGLKRVRSTTFGSYHLQLEKDGYDPVNTIIPKQLHKGRLVLDILVWWPGFFYNLMGPKLDQHYKLTQTKAKPKPKPKAPKIPKVVPKPAPKPPTIVAKPPEAPIPSPPPQNPGASKGPYEVEPFHSIASIRLRGWVFDMEGDVERERNNSGKEYDLTSELGVDNTGVAMGFEGKFRFAKNWYAQFQYFNIFEGGDKFLGPGESITFNNQTFAVGEEIETTVDADFLRTEIEITLIEKRYVRLSLPFGVHYFSTQTTIDSKTTFNEVDSRTTLWIPSIGFQVELRTKEESACQFGGLAKLNLGGILIGDRYGGFVDFELGLFLDVKDTWVFDLGFKYLSLDMTHIHKTSLFDDTDESAEFSLPGAAFSVTYKF